MRTEVELSQLADQIKAWGLQLGLDQIGITDTDLSHAEKRLQQWLAQGFQGDMAWMSRHGNKRSRPTELEPGTLRVISARLDYLPANDDPETILRDPAKAFVSRYALGRDYHKVLRKKLQQLADKIEKITGKFGYRVFVDSAPVLEKPIAEKAGLGWIGKHSNLINQQAGSWFFLGEIYTDLPLPLDAPAQSHCGTCQACLDICPTKAIVEPFVVDARRCISYLTIELKGPIPLEYRAPIGNRIYGCDDCQQACPWNRFAKPTQVDDFLPRQNLDQATLIELFAWSEHEFLSKTEGSAIRRIGWINWLRNIAVALGNAKSCPKVIQALQARKNHPSALVQEHVAWALERQQNAAF